MGWPTRMADHVHIPLVVENDDVACFDGGRGQRMASRSGRVRRRVYSWTCCVEYSTPVVRRRGAML